MVKMPRACPCGKGPIIKLVDKRLTLIYCPYCNIEFVYRGEMGEAAHNELINTWNLHIGQIIYDMKQDYLEQIEWAGVWDDLPNIR